MEAQGAPCAPALGRIAARGGIFLVAATAAFLLLTRASDASASPADIPVPTRSVPSPKVPAHAQPAPTTPSVPPIQPVVGMLITPTTLPDGGPVPTNVNSSTAQSLVDPVARQITDNREPGDVEPIVVSPSGDGRTTSPGDQHDATVAATTASTTTQSRPSAAMRTAAVSTTAHRTATTGNATSSASASLEPASPATVARAIGRFRDMRSAGAPGASASASASLTATIPRSFGAVRSPERAPRPAPSPTGAAVDLFTPAPSPSGAHSHPHALVTSAMTVPAALSCRRLLVAPVAFDRSGRLTTAPSRGPPNRPSKSFEKDTPE